MKGNDKWLKAFRRWQKNTKMRLKGQIETYMRTRTRIRDVLRATEFHDLREVLGIRGKRNVYSRSF